MNLNPRKYFRITIICLPWFLLLFLINHVYFTDDIMPPEVARNERIEKLQHWSYLTKIYVQENNSMPSSLYEVFKYSYSKGYKSPQFVVSKLSRLGEHAFVLIKNDPKQFDLMVEYRLYRSNDIWFIKEEKPGFYYTKYLMIDSNGQIYELQDLPLGAQGISIEF